MIAKSQWGIVIIVLLYLLCDFYFFYWDTPSTLCAWIRRYTLNPDPGPRGIHGQCIRFNSKQHLISRDQLLGYPIAYFFIVYLELFKFTYLTANLVSCIHPLFGIAAGYCIYRASCIYTSTQASKATSPRLKNHLDEDLELLEKENQVISTLNISSKTETPDLSTGSTTPSQGCRRHGAGDPLDATSVMPQSTDNSNRGAIKPSSCCIAIAATVTGGRGVFQRCSSYKTLLRFGAIFALIRSGLDQWDGVLARSKRLWPDDIGSSPWWMVPYDESAGSPVMPMLGRSGTNSSRPLVSEVATYGFNGHSLDVATDIIGVSAMFVGVLIFVWTRLPESKVFPTVLMIANKVKWKLPFQNPQQFKMLVCIIGIAGVFACSGFTWEKFMMRHVNLFDEFGPTQPSIRELEGSLAVRLNQWCWSLVCGDALVFYVVAAVFFDVLWPVAQVLCFGGLIWLPSMVLWSLILWNFVILKHPDALNIVRLNPWNFET